MFSRLLIVIVASCLLGWLLPRPSKVLAWFEAKGCGDHFIPLAMTLGTLWVIVVGLWIVL